MNKNNYKQFFDLILKTRRDETIMDSIIVDGPVGVGKTSLMEILTEQFGYQQFLEPITNNPLLDKFYYDRKKYAFPLQIFFLNKRFAMLKEAAEVKGSIMDRSIYGDVIFARLLSQGGDMDPEEYDLYEELLSNMLEHVQAPKLMIYLQTNVEDMVEKIKKRGRDYEQVVEREYWEKLNNEYEDYFENYNISPILVINVQGLDFVGNQEHRQKVIKLINAKLETLK